MTAHGRGSLMAKVDIHNAYRVVPRDENNFSKMTSQISDQLYG